jgi:hypothetical protein
MSIQRYNTHSNRSEDGIFVLYDDHVAAMEQAQTNAYVAGVGVGVRAAREAVVGVPKVLSVNDGEYECIWRDDAIAAIDGITP